MKINVFEHIFVLGFVHIWTLQGLSAELVIRSDLSTDFSGNRVFTLLQNSL